MSGTIPFLFSSYRSNFMLEEIAWKRENHHNQFFTAFQQTPNSVMGLSEIRISGPKLRNASNIVFI
jgi:hypothetical protein